MRHKVFFYFILVFSILALAFAYTLEFFDVYPCKLCIYQRIIYFILIITSIICLYKKDFFYKLGVLLTYTVICVGISIGIFQVLVEEQIIEYNSSCTTKMMNINSPEELLSSINSKDLVACDMPQIKIFFISLAGWNVIYMLFLLFISLFIRYKKDLPIIKI